MTDKREGLLKDIYDQAYNFERDYGFCPQAVLATIDDYFDIIDDQLIKATHAMAGGGALCGDGTCGGLIGGIAAISAVFGRSREQFGESSPDNWTNSSRIAKKLRQRFLDEFDSVICNDVQELKMGRSFDLWDPEDYKKFEEAGAHDDKCPDVTGKVARWTAEILIEEGIEAKK